VSNDLSLTSAGNLPGIDADQTTRLRKAATQFEAAFVQMLFQTMDAQKIDDEPLLGGDSASDQFKDLYHTGLGERAAGHLGIADMVFRELSARAGIAAPRPPAGPHP
jgi:Rod binding domain-containing protein